MGTGPLGFQEVHDTFQPKIVRYLARLVGEHESEDLTQEVFVKVHRALKRFRGESQLSTWIYRIATNTAIDRVRSASFRQTAAQSALDDALDLDGSVSLEERVMRQDMYDCFGRHVNDLPLSYRTVVVLSELEELTDKEIADVLGVSLATVKIRLHRGRAMLLGKLKADCKAEDWL